MGRTVVVRAPASSANLGPGFDALGIALNLTGDVRITLHDLPAPQPRSRIEQLALAAARAAFTHAGKTPPTQLQAEFRSDIPLGRGLGASAVLRGGAVMAANRILGEPLTPEAMLAITAELEGHADNAAPALLGGFQVVVWEKGTVTHITLPVPRDLQAVVLVPDFDMPTSETRRLMPAQVPFRDAVHNLGHAALVVAAIAENRLDVLRTATQDLLHQPARARVFPALFTIIDAATNAGAWCAYLSGGGSAVLALTSERAEAVGEAMLQAAQSAGLTGRYILTRPRACGAQIIVDEQTV